MKNPIRAYFDRRRAEREKKATADAQKQLLSIFATFEQAEKSRLVFLDTPNKRVLISDILTSPFALDDVRWHSFFQNLAYWFKFRINQEYWDKKRVEAEVEAVREARKQHKHLTGEELKIIRTHAQMNLEYSDVNLPDIEGYGFCICDGILRSDVQAEAMGVWRDGNIVMELKE